MNDHRTLFQNIEELVQLSEDILEQILQNEHDPQMHFVSRVYLSKSMALSAAYKKYCNGIKRSDCVLVSYLVELDYMKLSQKVTMCANRFFYSFLFRLTNHEHATVTS